MKNLKPENKIDCNFLHKYANRMKFQSNWKLFEKYIQKMSDYRAKTQFETIMEIKDFFANNVSKDYSRYMFLPEEIFIVSLPIIQHLILDRFVILFGRGMEPYNEAIKLLLKLLNISELSKNIVYLHLNRKIDGSHSLISQNILPLLTRKELNDFVDKNAWKKIIEKCEELEIYNQVNQWLITNKSIVGGLSALCNGKISRFYAIQLLGDIGIDNRFINFYNRARSIRFTDYLQPEDFYQDNHLSFNELIESLLKGRDKGDGFTIKDKEEIERAIQCLMGDNYSITTKNRDLILHYCRIFLFGSEFSQLRNTTKHVSRPLLNILLSDTEFAYRLVEQKNVICVDETINTGTAFLIAELLIRSFVGSPNLNIHTHVISSITKGLRKFLRESSAIDSFSCSEIWPQEDLNEYYQGFYHKGHGNFYFIRYDEAIKQLHNKCRNDKLNNKHEALLLLNNKIDLYIEKNKLFPRFENIKNFRIEPNVIKRELIKLYLRSTADDLTKKIQEMIYYDLTKSFSLFGDELCLEVLCKDILHDSISTLSEKCIPKEIVDLDENVRHLDQILYLSSWIIKNRSIRNENKRIISLINNPTCLDKINDYLNERIDYDELQSFLYGAL